MAKIKVERLIGDEIDRHWANAELVFSRIEGLLDQTTMPFLLGRIKEQLMELWCVYADELPIMYATVHTIVNIAKCSKALQVLCIGGDGLLQMQESLINVCEHGAQERGCEELQVITYRKGSIRMLSALGFTVREYVLARPVPPRRERIIN